MVWMKKKNRGGEILKEDLIRRFWRCRCDVESQYDLQVGTWGKGEGRWMRRSRASLEGKEWPLEQILLDMWVKRTDVRRKWCDKSAEWWRAAKYHITVWKNTLYFSFCVPFNHHLIKYSLWIFTMIKLWVFFSVLLPHLPLSSHLICPFTTLITWTIEKKYPESIKSWF